MYNSSNYSPDCNGFSGVKIKNLIKSHKFYKDKYQDTLNYLLSVYPKAEQSLKLLKPLELASFYNSLNYYYNCKFQSSNFSPLPCKDKFPLPYPPQGWFFNYYSFQKDNIPIVFSDSDESKDYLQLENFGSGNPSLAFEYRNDNERAGPGLFYFNARTLQRNVWFPNGISNTFINGKQEWNFVSGQEISWNYPKKWWKGLPSHSFIEITHTQPVPGLPQSPGWWWNAVTGSGIFLNLGKTISVQNKLEAVFILLKKMNKTFLKEYFGTIDIFQIIYSRIGDCICDEKYINCQKNCEPDYLGVLKASGLSVLNFKQEVVRFQNSKRISYSNQPTPKGIKEAIFAAINNTDYRLNRISSKILLDELIFFLGIHANLDTIQMTNDPNINGFFVFEILDLRVPDQYLPFLLKRNYTQILNIDNNPDDNKYKDDFIQNCLNNFVNNKIISVRDPLDIYNENKVEKCLDLNDLSPICENNNNYSDRWYNLYCNNVPLANEYKCLALGNDIDSCILVAENPTC
jgi:hypothetical protein